MVFCKSFVLILQVIFSQSSDTLDHQPSVGGSSGEETSIPEASSNDTLLGNESSGNELMVTFKGFDFLDNELEDSETEGFFTQLVDRRHSLHLEPSPTSSGRPNFGSEPNLQMITSNLSKRSPRDSVTEEPSTDEESESSEQEASGATAVSDSAGGPSASIQVHTFNLLRSSPLTASTHSLSSNAPSETDTVDLNSSQASPAFSQLSILLPNLQADEIEDAWRVHVAKVMVESSLSHIGKTCQIFPRLFRELRKRLTIMTKEAGYYISKTENLKVITSQILQVMDVVHQQLDCPFFYSESDVLLGSRLVDRHRFCVLEIQECFETYSMRKDQAEQSLEILKSSIKQQSLGDGGSYILGGEEQQLELCQRLYKLIFQLVLLFESYLKLLDVFQMVVALPQVNDMSAQVISVRNELILSLDELENGQASPFYVDNHTDKQEALAALAEYLHGAQYLKAIQILRKFRSQWPNDIFGMSTEDDMLTLLNIYCSNLAEKKQSVFALTKTSLELTPLYGQLMDINLHLRANRLSASSVSSTTTVPFVMTTISSPTSSRDGSRNSGGSVDGGAGGESINSAAIAEQRRLEILFKTSDSSIL
uniref:Protein furry C-terminal domain-containing protein n=1 Tax=Arion vulgaris TaxID=1028688 RepID=A0A0B7AGE7_9EUPU